MQLQPLFIPQSGFGASDFLRSWCFAKTPVSAGLPLALFNHLGRLLG